MRKWKKYPLKNNNQQRIRLLNFASQFQTFSFLDSCTNTVYGKPEFDFLLAAGCKKTLKCTAGNAFESLQQFIDETQDWCFGFFSYDLKNENEKLSSQHFDGIQLPDLYFFIPEVLVMVKSDEIQIGNFQLQDEIFNEIQNCSTTLKNKNANLFTLQKKISQYEYLSIVNNLKQHILNGDMYEINFCQEFFIENIELPVLQVFDVLCKTSKAPFSALMKVNNTYLISSSPERFLKKQGNKLISQPMKGTKPRSDDAQEDEKWKEQLKQSEKDRAENVMIVDLVRNDIAKSAKAGTIRVDGLFDIYTFEHVHQMVSTVSGELRDDIHPVQAIKNAFPMGSMTGAPKVMAMELIEQYEKTKRGLYSGAVGYFDPEKNFDFSVVIRSMLYHTEKKYLSMQAGSAIVFDSDAETEYEECLIKLAGLIDVLLVTNK